MRILTWNCCWKLKEKLFAVLAEEPHIAILQECSRQDLQNLPGNYKGQWLGGNPDHGLGMIYREPYSIESVQESPLLSFAAVKIAGPTVFTLIAAWNCKEAAPSYSEHLHQFLDQHEAWFAAQPVILAGDLNSEAGAAFESGKRRHAHFVERMSKLGLTDCLHAEESPDATYRHLRSATSLFRLDYIFIPQSWLSKISSIAVGTTDYWSKLSDHSPLILTLNIEAT